jgi:large subunit ribosomal protein L1
MTHGKKYRAAVEKVEAGKVYSIAEAVAFLQANKRAKFDESVEIHLHLGINLKKSDESVRGTVVLPHGTGRTQKVAVVTSTKLDEATSLCVALAGEGVPHRIASQETTAGQCRVRLVPRSVD